MCGSLKVAFGGAQGAQGRPSPISRGVLGTPKSPDRSPEGVSEGPLGPSRMRKQRNEDEQCVFKMVKKNVGFYSFSGQVASPERAKCDRRDAKLEVGESK